VRRTTLAARLKAIYGSVDNVDAFVGMVSEPHLPGSDFGQLQYAMWKRQFEDLRDGDANFYRWNRNLQRIMREYGSDNIPIAKPYPISLLTILMWRAVIFSPIYSKSLIKHLCKSSIPQRHRALNTLCSVLQIR
jgi:hypothetical protein